MNFKKLILSIALIGAILVPGISYGTGLYDSTVVKVGLFYGSTAKPRYSLGDEPLIVNYNDSCVAYLDSGRGYSAEVLNYIYSSGHMFTTYEEALAKAKEIDPSGFVFFDGFSYLPCSRYSGMGMDSPLNMGNSIIVSNNKGDLLAFNSASGVTISTIDEVIKIDDVSYRGKLGLISDGNAMTAINYVNLDEYLKGVVGREMSSSWEIEALKAQAVVARNYTVMTMGKHSVDGFNLCGATHCQAYGGIKSEAPSIDRAIEETRGELIYYNGSPIQAYYHSSSGGHTEDNENVWSGSALPYLRGVNDSFAIGYPNSDWSVTLSGTEIKEALLSRGVDIGDIIDVRATKTTSSGRTVEMTVLGTSGSKVFYRDAIRSSIAPEMLKSTKFTITKNHGGSNSMELLDLSMVNDFNLKQAFTDLDLILTSRYGQSFGGVGTYTISGQGWGHGLGLSQYGAKGMAVAGYGYKDIIKHYFTGVEIR